MKQAIILWIAAAVITFVAGYLQSILSPDYPVNGTIDLSSGDASFSFEKIYRGKEPFKVWVATDAQNIKGVLEWKDVNDSAGWHTTAMKQSKNILMGEIPLHSPLSKINYKVTLIDQGKIFSIPKTSPVKLIFLGAVPSQISMFYFITLFGGLFLAVRTGLEIFKDAPRFKMYTIFTLIFFFSFTFVFGTVKKGCELGIIGGTRIVPIDAIFSAGAVALFIVWLAALILTFNLKKPKLWAASSSVLTIIIFMLDKF